MSANQKVVYKTQRKDVRRVYFNENVAVTSGTNYYVIHTATEKSTLMGFELQIGHANAENTPTEDVARASVNIQVCPSGKYQAPLSSGAVLDSDLPTGVIREFKHLIPDQPSCIMQPWYATKAKRKLAKGEIVYLGISFNKTHPVSEFICHGFIYIGE